MVAPPPGVTRKILGGTVTKIVSFQIGLQLRKIRSKFMASTLQNWNVLKDNLLHHIYFVDWDFSAPARVWILIGKQFTALKKTR